VHVTASATGQFAIVHMRIYIDNNVVFDTDASALDTLLADGLRSAQYGRSGMGFARKRFRRRPEFYGKRHSGGFCGLPATDQTINICSPTAGST